MDDRGIDEILSREDSIVPSSGFVSSVMDAVRQEASVPPPIPFPWKWAIPGLAAAIVAVSALVLQGAAALAGKSANAPLPARWNSAINMFVDGLRDAHAGWIFMALLLTWVSVGLSIRQATRRA